MASRMCKSFRCMFCMDMGWWWLLYMVKLQKMQQKIMKDKIKLPAFLSSEAHSILKESQTQYPKPNIPNPVPKISPSLFNPPLPKPSVENRHAGSKREQGAERKERERKMQVCRKILTPQIRAATRSFCVQSDGLKEALLRDSENKKNEILQAIKQTCKPCLRAGVSINFKPLLRDSDSNKKQIIDALKESCKYTCTAATTTTPTTATATTVSQTWRQLLLSWVRRMINWWPSFILFQLHNTVGSMSAFAETCFNLYIPMLIVGFTSVFVFILPAKNIVVEFVKDVQFLSFSLQFFFLSFSAFVWVWTFNHICFRNGRPSLNHVATSIYCTKEEIPT